MYCIVVYTIRIGTDYISNLVRNKKKIVQEKVEWMVVTIFM